MADSYVPGFSTALMRSLPPRNFAVGGLTSASPARPSTKASLVENLSDLAAAVARGENPTMDPAEARLVAGLQKPTYSPETNQYMSSVADYMSGLGVPELGQYYNSIQQGRSVAGPTSNINVWNPEASFQNRVGLPTEQNVGYYASLYGGDEHGPVGSLNVNYNTPVALVNNVTGEIIGQGTGFQSAQDLIKSAQGLTSSGGNKADWALYTGAPGQTDVSQYTKAAWDNPDKGVMGTLGDIAKIAAPIALQFVPGLGTALGASLGLSGLGATAVGTGLTAALGRTGAGIASGDSVLGSLKAGLTTGALSGLTAGALQGLGAIGGSGMPGGLPTAGNILSTTNASLAGTALPGAVGSAAASVPGQIVVNAAGRAVPAALGGLGAAGANALGNIVTSPNAPQPSPTQGIPATTGSPLEVIGNVGALSPTAGAVSGAIGGLGNIATSPNAPAQSTTSNLQDPQTPELTNVDPIVVKGLVDKGFTAAQLAAIGIPAAAIAAATVGGAAAPAATAAKPGILEQIGDLSTLDKIRLAGLGLGTIGDLFSGGSSTSAGTIPGGLNGGLNPLFSAKLPTANLPAAAPRTAADMAGTDYYRYGHGPEQSFFNNVPKGAPNTSQAYTGYAHGGSTGGEYAGGGSSFAVGGPGDGREDKIPAMLSDGEYIIDAETVALLGNGSSKAGAKALDGFRVNVRKQKGRKLATGKFSDDAKRPEQYLKGRK